MSDRIFLVGPMGAGKSAVGKALARSLRLDFEDSDQVIEARTGVDIGFIFEKEGEPGFRRREAEAIDRLSRRDGIVLATGGGAVVTPANRRRLGRRGTVVYLVATPEQQYARVRHSTHRPLIDTADPQAALRKLFEIRDPLYRGIADIVVETDGARVAEVARRIRTELEALRDR
ncbi:MAG: shikimate kinase AroK [Pseudomonadota bacterium]